MTHPLDSQQPRQETGYVGDYPGRRLGILGLVLACTLNTVGLVVAIVAFILSVRNGHRNPAALAGIIIGAIGTLVFLAALWYLGESLAGNIGPCAELGTGVQDGGLLTYTCPE